MQQLEQKFAQVQCQGGVGAVEQAVAVKRMHFVLSGQTTTCISCFSAWSKAIPKQTAEMASKTSQGECGWLSRPYLKSYSDVVSV